MRMVSGIHYYSPNLWSTTHVAISAGLTQLYVFVIDRADLAYGRHTFAQNLANLPRWQPDQCITVFSRQNLRGSAGTTYHLSASADLQLDIVDQCTVGDGLQG